VSNEFDNIEDSALRRALDRARVLADRPDDDAVEQELASLLQGEPDAPTTLDQALGELPRFLARGRGSGLFRLPPEVAQAPTQPVLPPSPPLAGADGANGTNGTPKDD
jgi:hypothetical protein